VVGRNPLLELREVDKFPFPATCRYRPSVVQVGTCGHRVEQLSSLLLRLPAGNLASCQTGTIPYSGPFRCMCQVLGTNLKLWDSGQGSLSVDPTELPQACVQAVLLCTLFKGTLNTTAEKNLSVACSRLVSSCRYPYVLVTDNIDPGRHLRTYLRLFSFSYVLAGFFRSRWHNYGLFRHTSPLLVTH
jgi:hypothetical protein